MKKILKFQAEWCGPCHAIRPAINQISAETGIEVEEIDIDVNNEVSDKYAVASIPTIVLLEDGQEVARHIGSAPKSIIMKNLNL